MKRWKRNLIEKTCKAKSYHKKQVKLRITPAGQTKLNSLKQCDEAFISTNWDDEDDKALSLTCSLPSIPRDILVTVSKRRAESVFCQDVWWETCSAGLQTDLPHKLFKRGVSVCACHLFKVPDWLQADNRKANSSLNAHFWRFIVIKRDKGRVQSKWEKRWLISPLES